jgi:hypothetical protein
VATQPALPAAPPAAEVAKKTTENLGDRKNQAGLLDKADNAYSDERKGAVAKVGPDAQNLTEQLTVNGTLPGGYSYNQNTYGQSTVPMNRALRLRSGDAQYAIDNRIQFEGRAAGEKAQAKPGEPAAATEAPAVAGRPQPAKPDDATKAKNESGAAQATQRLAADDKLAEKPAFDNVAQGQVPMTLGYELPPDYHEALFIFRVVSPTAGGKANAEGAPADAAKPQPTGGTAPKSKAD